VPQGSAIFLDTSIQIARFAHGPEIKAKINARIAEYDLPVSSEVVRLEFKRRFLKEAQYLLNQLNRLGSYQRVNRHVIDVLPAAQNRKRNICLEMLGTILEGRSDADLTERAKRYLRTLIKFGLDDFEDTVKHIVRAAGCACARFPIKERKRAKDFDFGPEKCSSAGVSCGVVEFLGSRSAEIGRILDELRSIPSEEKTEELRRAEEFIGGFLSDPTSVPSYDPCLKVGDLLIALESVGFDTFYTLNVKESKHLARRLDQVLIVRPKYHVHDDIVCPKTEPNWGPILSGGVGMSDKGAG
jgi:hypothetical protein